MSDIMEKSEDERVEIWMKTDEDEYWLTCTQFDALEAIYRADPSVELTEIRNMFYKKVKKAVGRITDKMVKKATRRRNKK